MAVKSTKLPFQYKKYRKPLDHREIARNFQQFIPSEYN